MILGNTKNIYIRFISSNFLITSETFGAVGSANDTKGSLPNRLIQSPTLKDYNKVLSFA